jgi:hypothetical protein
VAIVTVRRKGQVSLCGTGNDAHAGVNGTDVKIETR